MFHEVATIGSLDMQLVYFRGTERVDAECKASGWMTSPMQLAAAMTKVSCLTGLTQIRRVLDHALRETTRRKVDALVFVGDACEEPRIHLVTLAEELGRLKVPVFMFQEGHDPEAAAIFPAIAEASRGAYRQFNSSKRPAARRAAQGCGDVRDRRHRGARTAGLRGRQTFTRPAPLRRSLKPFTEENDQ